MQGLKGFLSAVLLCTAVHAIGDIISHEMYRNWNDESIWNDPAWQNFTATFNNGRASLFNSTFINSTSNNNVMTLDGDGGTFKDYYRSTLPRELISFAFISALMYFWDILLEYFLPTRPRGIGVGAETEKAIGLDIPWADKTLCRLIAKGRARRASISWGNVPQMADRHYFRHNVEQCCLLGGEGFHEQQS
ncbi:hypothetical protein V2G26_001912 [Clonostachys chloroleuca]